MNGLKSPKYKTPIKPSSKIQCHKSLCQLVFKKHSELTILSYSFLIL